MLPFLFAGMSLGAAAGISPGPLLALLVSQTLRHGLRDGVRVAFAPALSDVPIILLCLFVLRSAANLGSATAWMFLLGGCFVAYLGYDSLRTSGLGAGQGELAPRSMAKAVAVNLLNPHVYLFWATVGAPMLVQGWKRADGSAAAFLGGFYACLIGSKVVVAVLVDRSRDALNGRGYKLAMRIMGVLLLAVAVWMLASGVTSLP